MSATFATRNLAGPVGRQITVTTNDPQQRTAKLQCRSRVLVPFHSNPRYINFLKIEDSTTPLPQTVTLRRGDGGPLSLELVPDRTNSVFADLNEITPGEHYELVIALSPPQRPGKLRSWVRLKTGVEQMPETTIPVYAEVPQSWSESELASANR